MNRPRLLHIITLAEVGGSQSHVLELLRGFSGHYDLHLATGEEGPLTEAARSLGVKTYLLPTLRRDLSPREDWQAIAHCKRLVEVVQPTLVHSHTTKSGLVARLALRGTGVPLVHTAHGWGFSPGAPTKQRLFSWLSEAATIRRADHTICVSHFDDTLGRRALPIQHDKISVVHNGIDDLHDLAAQTKRAFLAAAPIQIVMTARFCHQKHQALLLRAFAALGLDDGVARLVFAGTGPELEIRRDQARQLGIEKKCCFLGDCHDVPALLAQSQIFVLASRHEGLPVSILEAMRAGLPVIASDVGGVKEQVEHETTGLLVPINDELALTKALDQLISNTELRQSYGQAGRLKFEREFSARAMLDAISLIYNKVERHALDFVPRVASDEVWGLTSHTGTVIR